MEDLEGLGFGAFSTRGFHNDGGEASKPVACERISSMMTGSIGGNIGPKNLTSDAAVMVKFG